MSPSAAMRRGFGSLLIRLSNGVSHKPFNSISTHRTGDSRRNSSSISRYSCSGDWISVSGLNYGSSERKISTCTPLFMGRRSSKIADRKSSQNLKKMKVYSRFGKELVSAIKKGGPNPVSNLSLAALIDKSKELDIPRDILDRNIKKASEKGQESYVEKFYEVYGYGGVGMILQVLTDKVHRSVAAIRDVCKNHGGKMADSGSILFKFKRARVLTVKASDVDKDELLILVLDAGADDVIEPSMDEDTIKL